MIKLASNTALLAFALTVSSGAAHASSSAPERRTVMAPETLEFSLPPPGSRLVLSLPIWRAESTDETPYQLMQLCDQTGECETLADLRGMSGMSIASDPTLALSPDRMYVIILRHVGVDPTRQSIRTNTFETYGVAERGAVAFRTAEGKEATTDNILGWDPATGHGLEVSTGHRKKALAFPVSP